MRVVLSVGVVLGFTSQIFGQTGRSDSAEPRRLLLSNVRIVDVESAEVSQATRVLIEGRRIARIGSNITPPANTKQIDLQGRFLLPGLVDLHSHLLLHPYNEATWNDQVLKEALELRVIRGTIHARDTLQSGFTTIRDLGTEGAAFADVALRDAINKKMIPGPRVLAVTRALVTSGGYGPSGFDPRFKLPKGAQPADGVADVRRVTREQIAAGADWIKVYADYRRRAGDRSTPTFSQAELEAIVDEAKSAGIKVAAHATTNEGIRRAVMAGVVTIEHGYDATVETLELMANRKVVLCPTLAASESMAMYSGWKLGQPDHQRIKTARRLVKNALTSGVTIACGSDVGVFAHGTSYRELELMHDYGIPTDEVLRSATITATTVLGMQNELGLVKPKFIADLIVLEKNPLSELSTLRKPKMVIQSGNIVLDARGQ